MGKGCIEFATCGRQYVHQPPIDGRIPVSRRLCFFMFVFCLGCGYVNSTDESPSNCVCELSIKSNWHSVRLGIFISVFRRRRSRDLETEH